MSPPVTPFHRRNQESLPEQIASFLRKRIETGEYAPGRRLDSVRALAGAFGTSPVTVLKALDLLVGEELLTRNVGRGFYVTRRVGLRARTLTCCFTFPERELVAHHVPDENDSIQTDFYRGLLSACQDCRVSFHFQYFADNPSPALLQLQAAQLSQFDFAIFSGHQLSTLRDLSAKSRPTFCLMNPPAYSNCAGDFIQIDYDRKESVRQLLGILANSGASSAAVVTCPHRLGVSRIDDFLQGARQLRLPPPTDWPDTLMLDFSNQRRRARQLRSFLPKAKGSFLFCDSTDMILPIYETAMTLGWRPGRDFQLVGIASGGGILGGLLPHLTFLQIPFYQMARNAVQTAEAHLRNGSPLPKQIMMATTLVQGATVHFPPSSPKMKGVT